MQNWDRNLQDVKFKQKLNNIRSTLPKISSANNASSSLLSKKPSIEKSSPNLNNLENLYINVTNKMKQLSSSPGKATNNVVNNKKNKNMEMKKQNYLKHLLNEFGLSQYLRKLYELGYDDNNINKIGLMSRKKFQELVLNMKMYPGQSIKMEKLYDYLKQLNLANTMYNTRLIGAKNHKMKNNNKKTYNSEVNKRRIKTASGFNNIVNNNQGIYTNYGNIYLNNKNNNVNLNINNNKEERPKTSTNIKIKPIQKTGSMNYPTANNNNKTKSKTLDNNINNYAMLTPSYYLNSIQSSNINSKTKSNNILLNSFKKGDLGYGFYMNNNINLNNNIVEDSKNQKLIPNNYLNEDLISQNDCRKDFNKFENINKYNNNVENCNDGELIEEKMTENIDNMLKYYMVQLNEKLDDSYGTVEDSSLSYNVSIPFNELNKKQNKINIETDDKINIDKNKNTGKLKLPSLNDKQNTSKKEEELKNKNKEDIKSKAEIKNKNDIINNNTNNNINNKDQKDENINEIKEKEKESSNEVKDNKTIEGKESTNENNNNQAKILSEQEQNNDSNSNINANNINKKAEENKNDSSIEDINLDDLDKEEEHIKEEKNENINKDPIPIINNNNQEKQEIKESTQNIPKEKENEKVADIDENIEIIDENKNDIENQEIKYGFHGEKTVSSEQPNTPQGLTQTQNERYSLEENIYDNLRLTKSGGEEYLHQNMEKFDIEYMCRCLSLAIMKLIESGKGKQHITDLMEKDNEKFEFFNTFFNSNYNIISDFFGKNKNIGENNTNNLDNNNIDNKMSNLEKLELQENKPINNDNEEINFLKHLKKDIDEKLIKEQEIKDRQFKLKNNLVDIEKDIKFIDEFFSINRQRTKNYKGLTDKTKNIMSKELSYINEVDSEVNNTKTNSMISNLNNEKNNISKQNEEEEEEKKELEENYENEFNDEEIINKKNEENNENKENNEQENVNNINNEINNKFSSISDINNKDSMKLSENKEPNNEDINTNLKIDEIIKSNNEQIKEELPQINKENKDLIESGSMESDYIIDINTMDKFKTYLLKQAEVFDDDFLYSAMHIPTRKYVPPPDPQVIFEFCANIMILTKMEKEVIIITLLYLERFIFNTGLLLTSRNWRRIIFITMAIASKIWDDDSFENNHFAQVFKHLSIGEINLLERTFLEMINYKVYVKCSEYFKYFFIIKSIALKYNYNGVEMIPISVERMMKIQEYAYQMQKRVRKKINVSNSTSF